MEIYKIILILVWLYLPISFIWGYIKSNLSFTDYYISLGFMGTVKLYFTALNIIILIYIFIQWFQSLG